jgi:hypothetical protein
MENDFPEHLAAVFEVAVPSKSHEDVRNGQEQDRFGFCIGCFRTAVAAEVVQTATQV